MFQDANLLPWLNVEDNVALPLRVRGVRRAERRARARELCAITGVDGFLRHRPSALSLGMRQRVALARALAETPSLLLLDEPFASLDAITRDAMNLELQSVLQAHPSTCLLITHAIAEAVFLADSVVSMSSRPGRIVDVTPVDFPRPRPMELQHAPEFQALVRSLRETLLEVSGDA